MRPILAAPVTDHLSTELRDRLATTAEQMRQTKPAQVPPPEPREIAAEAVATIRSAQRNMTNAAQPGTPRTSAPI